MSLRQFHGTSSGEPEASPHKLDEKLSGVAGIIEAAMSRPFPSKASQLNCFL
ncbi:hypothetical protein MA16_Dca029179 [Dendrobium catenatum]|uniref:Uncharacterized protein n=1 Tax=Dendrobium catenatum TaxID=906689 RepID=A0A2I0VBY4_9ASPA|nr:hypothetical protein MA16_Dca029179 [Dendrobium catenatum]